MKLEIGRVGHLSADETDALLHDTCNEAHPSGKSIQTRDNYLRIFALRQLDCTMQFDAQMSLPDCTSQRSAINVPVPSTKSEILRCCAAKPSPDLPWRSVETR